ncbi:MAG: hypothetical protein ABFD79_10280 [Phycisphaerales bacterium]
MRKKGVLTFQLVILLTVMTILLSSGVIYTSQLVRNTKVQELKTECSIIDRSLEAWASSHKKIQENSIVYDKTGTVYAQQRLYPKTLTDLGELQTRGFFSSKIDLAKFHYATQDNGTAYQLEVNLPDGTIYKSQQSAF